MNIYDVFDLFVSIVFFMVCGLFLLAQLYFAYFKVNELSMILIGSDSVNFRKVLFGRDFLSRLVFVNKAASMIMFPQTHIKNGTLTRDDLNRIPEALKFQLKMMVCVAFFLSGFAFVAGGTQWFFR